MACEKIGIVDPVVYVRIRDVMRVADMKTLEKVGAELCRGGDKT